MSLHYHKRIFESSTFTSVRSPVTPKDVGAAEHVAEEAGFLLWAPGAQEVGSYSYCLLGQLCTVEGVCNPEYLTKFGCIQLSQSMGYIFF